MRLSSFVFVAVLGLAFVLHPSPARAQVSLTTLGTPYTQSFDTLATSGTTNTWADNSTITGWYAQFTTTTNPTTYRADAGGSTTGAVYSWGTGTNTERALGTIGSGTTGDIFYGVRLVNNTGSTLTSLSISFTGEQWRAAGCTPTPCTPAAQTVDFQYQVANAGVITDANAPATGWLDHDALDFTTPSPGTSTAAALDGNAAANRTALSSTLTVTVNASQEVWLRWKDINHSNNDHGLAIDDFSVTPQSTPTPTLNVSDMTQSEGDPPGTTTFTFAVTLTVPAGPGGVTFDIATADGTAQDGNPGTEDTDYAAQSLTGQTIPSGSTGPYNFNVTVDRDTTVEPDETFFVDVTNISGANPGDSPGLGTIQNDDVTAVFIHEVQGSGASTPIPGATVTVEGVVTGNFQGTDRLRGFFLQEEDADVDNDPLTSEGVFVFCSSCPTSVAEGQRVQVTGSVSEFNGMTEITASFAGSVVVVDAGNHLAEVTATPIDLPVAGDIDGFYEPLEGMLVTFVDTLTLSEYFELAHFGHLELFEGGRPRQFTEASLPSAAGYTAHLDNLDRRRVIVDDDDNGQNAPLLLPDGSQYVFHPQANGGFSTGTQGIDFFRGGDVVVGLTGILHWSFPGTGADTWRIRPTSAHPVTFTVANPRPAAPPAVGGAIRVVSMNLLNYFTTIDTTSSQVSGPCAPSMTQDCRGADSVAELDRQRERAALVICGLDADVLGFMELENTTPTATIDDLLGAVNASCGGADPYAFVSTGGTLGTDAIRVALIYRSATLSPAGSPLVDLDAIHNRPPTAQTFDVADPLNPAFGERFTVIANHFKSKGCGGATGPDADAGDGQGCYNGRRTSQATRLLTWISGTVIPAAGDPDVLLLGDFNSYAKEDPVTTLTGGGYVDLASKILGPSGYSYLFDGQLGHLDYAFASASLATKVSSLGNWHINADEASLFDYNDGVKDTGEATYEEKPDGSALVPPRNLFQAASPFRASDHDPVLAGLFGAGNHFTLTPCRAVDTRTGPGALQNEVLRTFPLQGVCGIPPTAMAVVLNITAVLPTNCGNLTLYPSDATPPPEFFTLPFPANRTRALFAVIPLSRDAAGAVAAVASTKGMPSCSGTTTVHLVLDVMGYFE